MPTTTRSTELNDSGINGSGHQVFQVVTTVVTATGTRYTIETFDTRAEAENWIKWAC